MLPTLNSFLFVQRGAGDTRQIVLILFIFEISQVIGLIVSWIQKHLQDRTFGINIAIYQCWKTQLLKRLITEFFLIYTGAYNEMELQFEWNQPQWMIYDYLLDVNMILFSRLLNMLS